MSEVFSNFLPALPLTAREAFRQGLIELLGTAEAKLTAQAQLYLTSSQLREMAALDFEIGNHTYTHIHGRSLTQPEFEEQIDRNKTELQSVTGREVRSFSVPYGSSKDLPTGLAAHLQDTGHEAAFLVESRTNRPGADRFRFNRVSIRAGRDAGFFSEIEILPRFRAIRNWLSSD
jgi:hypothetical protein